MRLELLDGIRGHLLVGMLIAHLGFRQEVASIGLFHHHTFIGMHDAEFFIPISGFIIGYLFTERLRTASRLYGFLHSRLWTIYKYYLLSAVPFLILAFAAEPSWGIINVSASVLLMQEGGAFSDILPIYFYCFLLLYALFWTVPRVGFAPALTVSGALYLLSQTGYQTGMFGLSSRFVVFDIAAWQFLFMIFLFIGARSQDAAEIIKQMSPRAYFIVVVILVGLLIVGSLTDYYPTPFAGHEALPFYWPRLQLHPLFLAKILIVCAIFSCVILRPDGLLRWPSFAARWYFTRQFLRNVGKYSIQMFTLHVFMMALFEVARVYLAIPGLYMLAFTLIAAFIAAPSLWIIIKARLAPEAVSPA